jgi:hypothetical protein
MNEKDIGGTGRQVGRAPDMLTKIDQAGAIVGLNVVEWCCSAAPRDQRDKFSAKRAIVCIAQERGQWLVGEPLDKRSAEFGAIATAAHQLPEN